MTTDLAAQQRKSRFRYELFGLSVLSAIDLPELHELHCDTLPAISIRVGVVASLPSGEEEAPGLVTNGKRAILTISGVARFEIVGGRQIIIDAVTEAPPANVRLFLLGSAMGILLHQRGIVPLHANAIDTGTGAIAFLGPSGAGKSTLAAAFHDQGFPILSDDVCALARLADHYFAMPGVPRLRLWRDALENSGRNADGCERVLDSADKFTVPTDRASDQQPRLLRAIFVLARGDPGEGGRLRELSGVSALQPIVENTYRGGALRLVGNSQAYFATCLELAQKVPVFEFRRPWDATRIPQDVALIVQHLAGLPLPQSRNA